MAAPDAKMAQSQTREMSMISDQAFASLKTCSSEIQKYDRRSLQSCPRYRIVSTTSHQL